MKASVFERIVDRLANNEIIPTQDKDLYTYGLKQGLWMVMHIITTLVIGFVFGMVLESFVFMLVYIPLRTYAGGYHATTYGRCYLFSVLMISIVLRGIKTFQHIDSLTIIFIAIACTGGIIYLLGPVESENKPLSKRERKVYKQRIGMILLFLFTIELVLSISGQEKLVISIIMALIALVVMMIVEIIKNKIQIFFWSFYRGNT